MSKIDFIVFLNKNKWVTKIFESAQQLIFLKLGKEGPQVQGQLIGL
jgi:hypothetical protein